MTRRRSRRAVRALPDRLRRLRQRGDRGRLLLLLLLLLPVGVGLCLDECDGDGSLGLPGRLVVSVADLPVRVLAPHPLPLACGLLQPEPAAADGAVVLLLVTRGRRRGGAQALLALRRVVSVMQMLRDAAVSGRVGLAGHGRGDDEGSAQDLQQRQRAVGQVARHHAHLVLSRDHQRRRHSGGSGRRGGREDIVAALLRVDAGHGERKQGSEDERESREKDYRCCGCCDCC